MKPERDRQIRSTFSFSYISFGYFYLDCRSGNGRTFSSGISLAAITIGSIADDAAGREIGRARASKARLCSFRAYSASKTCWSEGTITSSPPCFADPTTRDSVTTGEDRPGELGLGPEDGA